MPNSYVKIDPESGKRLILVVEDEEINREILVELISGDYEVITRGGRPGSA